MSGINKVDMGSIDLIVTDEAEQSYAVYSLSGIACTNKDASSGKFWQEGEDFTFNVKVVSPDNVDRKQVRKQLSMQCLFIMRIWYL